MSDREFLFPIPGSALRKLLDRTAFVNEVFSEDEATADIMLDLDRIDRGQQKRLKPVRYYAQRWGWARMSVQRALKGDPARDVDAWIITKAHQWRSFYGDSRGQGGDNGGQEPAHIPPPRPIRGQGGDNGGQGGDSTEQTTDTSSKDDGDNSRAREAEPDLFDDFWKAYPRKVGKKPARQKWRSKKLHLDPDLARTIIADVERRKAHDEQWQEVRYVPHPSTYLNQERWTDEPEPESIHTETDQRAAGLEARPGDARLRDGAAAGAGIRRGQAPRSKRDGELSPGEYLERAGYTAEEAERLLGISVGEDREDRRRLPPAPQGDGR